MDRGCLFLLATLLMAFQNGDAACTFPSHLTGTFDESMKGVLFFTSNQMSSYTLHTFGSFNFECVEKFSTTQYVLKSTTTISYFSLDWDAYLCWDITEVSTDKFLFHESAESLPDAGGEHVKMYFTGVTPTYADVCSTSSYTTGSYRFLMRNDTIASTKISCPSQLEFFWTYTVDTGSGDSCAANDTSFHVCSETTALTFNSSLCSNYKAFSNTGTVNCLYSQSVGNTTYLTTYNDDTVDNTNTFRFTCLVLDLSSSTTVYATQYPQGCTDNQTSTYVETPGAKLVLTYNKTCVDPTTTTATTTPTTTITTPMSTAEAVVAAASLDWVAGAVIGILIFIALVIASYFYCFYHYKKVTNARDAKIIDSRAKDDDPRGPGENYQERGAPPPNLDFAFPDYSLRFHGRSNKHKHGDKERLVKRDYNERPVTPSGISFRDTESPDSALGMDEDDGYPILRSQRNKPVSDFMKRLISLHEDQREKEKERAKVPEEKRFTKAHGRHGFKSEKDLADSAGMNLVSKIKKMARKKRRTAAIESKAPTEPEILDENIQNEAYEAKTVEDDVDSLASEELPAQLDVSQLLAYTALPPISPEPPRGTPEKRQKAVTIANKVSNDMVVEDLDNDRANADNIDGEGGSPGRAMDASKIYTIGNSVVSPNMKVRREPVSVKVKGESYLAKIHRKASVRAAVPDIETARSTGERFRRSAGDENWGKYLDEIYPDKMYFDYAKGTSMRSESHLRHSSDDALDYLYDRAMYWKNTGSKTARPNSRAKSTRSVHRKVRSAQSDNSVSRSRSVSSKLYRDSQI